jgi:hypothetical protein
MTKWKTKAGINRDITLPDFFTYELYEMSAPSALEFALGAQVYFPDIRGDTDSTREAIGRILVWRLSRGWLVGEKEPSDFYEKVYRDLIVTSKQSR